jgi:hypothetical protein
MYQNHTTMEMLAKGHQADLLREAHNARLARQVAGHDGATERTTVSHQVALVLVTLLVVLGAMALL